MTPPIPSVCAVGRLRSNNLFTCLQPLETVNTLDAVVGQSDVIHLASAPVSGIQQEPLTKCWQTSNFFVAFYIPIRIISLMINQNGKYVVSYHAYPQVILPSKTRN